MSTAPAHYLVLSAEHAKLLFPSPERHELRAALAQQLAKGACVVSIVLDDYRFDPSQIIPLANGPQAADLFDLEVKITAKGERSVRLRQGEWQVRAPVQLNAWNDLPGAGQVFLSRKALPTQVYFPEGANRDQVVREVRELSGYGVRFHSGEEATSLGVRMRVEMAFK